MAEVKDEPEAPAAAPPKRRGSMLKFLAAMILLTGVAAGAGGFLGLQLANTVAEAAKQKADAEAAKGAPVASRYGENAHLKQLPTIVTNLAAPADVWVRLEASLVLDDKAVGDGDVLAGEVGQDVLAFLRTVTLAQIEGASGMQHLREDLDERVAIRTEGRAREMILQTLVIE